MQATLELQLNFVRLLREKLTEEDYVPIAYDVDEDMEEEEGEEVEEGEESAAESAPDSKSAPDADGEQQ